MTLSYIKITVFQQFLSCSHHPKKVSNLSTVHPIKLMLYTRYSGGISQLQLKPGRIHLLPKVLSLAGKQGQKAQITSGLDKQSFFHWSDSQQKHDDDVFDTRVPSVHHKTTTKRRMMPSLLKQSPKIQRERTEA